MPIEIFKYTVRINDKKPASQILIKVSSVEF